MILDVHVGLKTVATLYRERDEYVLRYLPEAAAADFVSLTMPVREQPWKGHAGEAREPDLQELAPDHADRVTVTRVHRR